ncbi:MAG: hypothetical protein ACOC3E_02240 [Cyanobacteriota bacterium]
MLGFTTFYPTYIDDQEFIGFEISASAWPDIALSSSEVYSWPQIDRKFS